MSPSPSQSVHLRGIAMLLLSAAILAACAVWAVREPPSVRTARLGEQLPAPMEEGARKGAMLDLAAFERPIWGRAEDANLSTRSDDTETEGVAAALEWRFLGLVISPSGDLRAILYDVESKEIIKAAPGEMLTTWRIDSITEDLVVLKSEDGGTVLHIDPGDGSVRAAGLPTASDGESS